MQHTRHQDNAYRFVRTIPPTTWILAIKTFDMLIPVLLQFYMLFILLGIYPNNVCAHIISRRLEHTGIMWAWSPLLSKCHRPFPICVCVCNYVHRTPPSHYYLRSMCRWMTSQNVPRQPCRAAATIPMSRLGRHTIFVLFFEHGHAHFSVVGLLSKRMKPNDIKILDPCFHVGLLQTFQHLYFMYLPT